jgi:pyridoxine 4-dehydrogenase
VIPGTSSLEHLRENLKAASLEIPSEVLAELDAVAGQPAETTITRH